jgi:small subunit ribosomal protein S19
MVQKEFTYRGKTTAELARMSLSELALIMKSDARRKISRLTEADKKFIRKVEKSSKPVKTQNRDMIILPTFVGKQINIHNGKTYEELRVTSEMIGHWLGEYSMTRKKVNHSAPGVGATRSSSSMSVK